MLHGQSEGSLAGSRIDARPHALKDDVNAIIGVFKDGLEARVSGPHYNGSVTTDVYSLMGFTASFDKALEACLK